MKQVLTKVVRRRPWVEDFKALDGVSFEVFPGESVAVMGHNGSGKSTTLKLLSGVLRPSSGWIRTQGRVAGLLEVGAGFHPDLTGRENVYLNAAILGMTKEETDARFDEIVEFAEIGRFIDVEVKRYSSGMYARLGFSVAVHTELDVLLVDEVLSVGDAEFRAKCNAKMAEFQSRGKTMFVVSHNPAQVRKLCQRGIVLDHGRVIFDGQIDSALEAMRTRTAQAIVIDGVNYRKLYTGGMELQQAPKQPSWPVLRPPNTVEHQPLVSIGAWSCAHSSLQSVSVPEPVSAIARGAFYDCLELMRVELPSTLREIGTGAFRQCASLTEILLPEGVTTIRTRAFRDCKALPTIRLPRSLETLEAGAFAGCPNLVFECYLDSTAEKLLRQRVPGDRIRIVGDRSMPSALAATRQLPEADPLSDSADESLGQSGAVMTPEESQVFERSPGRYGR